MYLASDLSSAAVVPALPANVTDTYEPCTINPDHGYTVVYNVTLPAGGGGANKSDTLSIEMCSPGGYDQARRRLLVVLPCLTDGLCCHSCRAVNVCWKAICRPSRASFLPKQWACWDGFPGRHRWACARAMPVHMLA